MELTPPQRRSRDNAVDGLRGIVRRLGNLASDLESVPRTDVSRAAIRFCQRELETVTRVLKELDKH